ncbi:hypothetical protein V6N12_027513 [Hibiscus sabdariffa]|uniref:Uncharacterized protein n=1 Tax=Hibiscus sabdariffa TaxID=183260 RepID=A0ABR2F357_9ROSI
MKEVVLKQLRLKDLETSRKDISAEKRISAEILGRGRKGIPTGITIESEYSPEQPSIKIILRKGRKYHKSLIQSPCT